MMSHREGHATDGSLVMHWLVDTAGHRRAVAFIRVDEAGGYRYCIRAAEKYRCGSEVDDYDEVFLLALREPTAAARLVDALEGIACETRRAVREMRTAGHLVRGRGYDVRDLGPVCRWRARR